jgi:DNA-directed RNA polymerase specialized sigma24 family protein
MALTPNPDVRSLAADLYHQVRRPVMAWLQRRYPLADPEHRWDALIDALLYVAQHFDRFDPQRGSLTAFLAGVARRRLQTLLRGDRSRQAREKKNRPRLSHQGPSAANALVDALADRELVAAAREAIARAPEENVALDLLLLQADYPDYVRALGLTERPAAEAQAYVDRLLARLRQRLRRYRQQQGRQEGTP